MKSLLVLLTLLGACGEPTAQDPAPPKTPTTPVAPAQTPPPVPEPDPFTVKIVADANAIEGGETIALEAEANKKDATFAWKQASPKTPLGEFQDATAAATTWAAPAVTKKTKFVLSVTSKVGDEETEETVSLDVTPAPVKPDPQDPLAVTPSAASIVVGDKSQLAAKNTTGATAFAWTQKSPASPLGTFANATAASTSFTAPAIAAATSFELQLAYKDATGAAKTLSVTLAVTVPTYTGHIKGLFSTKCAGCHSGAGADGGFDITKTAQITANAADTSCGAGPRVKANAPNESSLFKRLKGTCPGGSGRMPDSDPTYFDAHKDDLAKIEAWISAGAQF